jgi:uncharacterized membrane protein YkoI
VPAIGARSEENMKPMTRSMVVVLALGVVACAGATRTATAAETHQAKVPIAEARAKALGLVAGAVVAEELEHEKGRWIYSFEIKPTGEKGNLIKEVNIDADTGALVGIETEHE